MMRWISLLIYKIIGWSTAGDVPHELSKYLIIVAPHTSNWDFPLGICAKYILRFDANFLGKKELFSSPIGFIFKFLGGVPVDRSKNTNLVDQVVETYNSREKFVIVITPEGTRSHSDQWKRGFYFIAKKAQVPIVKVAIDFKKKQIILDKPFYTTDSYAKDMNHIYAFYRDKTPRFPEKYFVPDDIEE